MKAKTELETLQGTWNVVTLEVGGQPVPVGQALIVLRGDRFTTSGMGGEYEGTIAVDARKEPKTLDMTFVTGPEKGKTNLGIFEVDGDTWRLCLEMTGKSRPQKFASAANTALETLRRASAEGRKAVRADRSFDITPAPELEGEWAMASCTINGEALPSPMVKQGRRSARNNEITVTMSGQTLVKARFTINRDAVPKTIDYLLASGELQHGIYELDGKSLKVIFSAPGRPRPADFATANGDGKTLTTWKLIKQ